MSAQDNEQLFSVIQTNKPGQPLQELKKISADRKGEEKGKKKKKNKAKSNLYPLQACKVPNGKKYHPLPVTGCSKRHMQAKQLSGTLL